MWFSKKSIKHTVNNSSSGVPSSGSSSATPYGWSPQLGVSGSSGIFGHTGPSGSSGVAGIPKSVWKRQERKKKLNRLNKLTPQPRWGCKKKNTLSWK